MKCKSCGRDVPDNSIFCNWCGEKLLKERKKKDEIKIPAPRKLPSGSWRIYLDAEKQSVTEKTKDLCISKAKAIRAGFIEAKKHLPKMTIGDAIDKMVADKQGVISPATIRGYKIARKHGFQKYMGSDISAKIDWQEAITEESKTASAKTVYNRWNVISAAMRYFKIEPPDVQLPKFKKGGQPYAYRNSRSRAFVIYNDETPIGMALYYDMENAYDFSQFFIDERYQGNGFGYQAAEMVMNEMRKDGVYDRVVLCYIDGNEAAKQLYLKLGFHHTGEADGDEIIMEKSLR